MRIFTRFGSMVAGVHGGSLALLFLLLLAPRLSADWPMAGANPQRTSWVPEQVPDTATIRSQGSGRLYPQWYRPIKSFIPGRVQIIAAHHLLYVASAQGLFAFDENGTLAWMYPTEMPLGHSPTISEGVAYVGSFDGRIHALDAKTGRLLGLSPAAGAGIQTNPLVADGTVYFGSRDGRFYAWRLGKDAWEWQFPAPQSEPLEGPILFSAAYHATDKVIYFAANDGHAYALRTDGTLVWKSAKLPGHGFHSWWPVVHRDAVIFAGSDPRRIGVAPPGGQTDILGLQLQAFFPKGLPKGTLRSPRAPDGWLDTSRPNVTPFGTIPSTSDYFEEHSDHRTYIVLDRANGNEFRYDFDADGKTEFSPLLFWGTHSGNRYPPVVGIDGNLYQTNLFYSDDWIPGGHVTGWRLHTPYLSTPASRWVPTDEPLAYSAGGNLIYWNQCCDRSAGAVDISQPNSTFPATDPSREWWYYSYDIDTLMPGYNMLADGVALSPYSGLPDCPGPYGGRNGVYQSHVGDQNPPIPYNGKVYSHRSNALVAFGVSKVIPASLPPAASDTPASKTSVPLTRGTLIRLMEEQVAKMLAAGHLKPAWGHHGLLDGVLDQVCGDQLSDYWHHPADIHIAMLQVLPHLSPETQGRVKSYLKAEMENFPVDKYTTVGWADGTPRGLFEQPLLATVSQPLPGPSATSSQFFPGWTSPEAGGPKLPPYFFYALWKYAAVLGDATALFERTKDRLPAVPSFDTLVKFPFVHNAFIAGYMGYLELEKLAGFHETTAVRQQLDRLMELRATAFTADTPYLNDPLHTQDGYCRALTVSRNFIFLTPELADYLRLNALDKVAAAVKEYEQVAPYWFVAFPETGIGEGTFSPLYDRLLFLAKAWILHEPQQDLVRFLDIPAFPVGDLFYLQMLAAALEAPATTNANDQTKLESGRLPRSPRDGAGSR